MTDLAQRPAGLAFKAKEIEELADVYFFRPTGMIFALAARAVGMTPTAVTLVGTAVGVVGGVLLARPERALVGFLVLILHGVLDSSDGQLARMTGKSSDFGRMMDGIGGYVTHVAIYLGILTSAWSHGHGWAFLGLMFLAAFANIVHAQMYDYHRSTYAAVAIKGEPTRAMVGHPQPGIVGAYEAMQRALSGLHPESERLVAAHQQNGRAADADRQRYRSCFYWPVRGWNLLGDNTRFYAIGVLAWFGRIEHFFLFELIPMNVAFVLLWLWQVRADRRFLGRL